MHGVLTLGVVLAMYLSDYLYIIIYLYLCSGDTSDEEERMVERQSDGESWQPNGESNDRTSGWKETQRETKEKME